MDFLDFNDAEQSGQQSLPAAPPSERVQEFIRRRDLFGALRDYREETGASLKRAMAVIKRAIAVENLKQ